MVTESGQVVCHGKFDEIAYVIHVCVRTVPDDTDSLFSVYRSGEILSCVCACVCVCVVRPSICPSVHPSVYVCAYGVGRLSSTEVKD